MLVKREIPRPGVGELLIEVEACAVCRTDLHVVDGDLKDARLPLIPGHEIVGKVVGVGKDVVAGRPDTRAGDAIIVGTGPKTFAMSLYLPDTPVTAGSLRMWSLTTVSPLNLIRQQMQFLWHHFYMPA